MGSNGLKNFVIRLAARKFCTQQGEWNFIKVDMLQFWHGTRIRRHTYRVNLNMLRKCYDDLKISSTKKNASHIVQVFLAHRDTWSNIQIFFLKSWRVPTNQTRTNLSEFEMKQHIFKIFHKFYGLSISASGSDNLEKNMHRWVLIMSHIRFNSCREVLIFYNNFLYRIFL